MAPEIVKYNGEEEYTEKVDCFSFGMLIYELLTLHQPFVGYETVKQLILEGGRPPLTPRELIYPTYVLDLMVVCWAQQPRERPSASQIVSIASAPEFLRYVLYIEIILCYSEGTKIMDTTQNIDYNCTFYLGQLMSYHSTEKEPKLVQLQLPLPNKHPP